MPQPWISYDMRGMLIPDATPLSLLPWVGRRVPSEDRLRFLIEMLTPHERRVLQDGFEDTEEPTP